MYLIEDSYDEVDLSYISSPGPTDSETEGIEGQEEHECKQVLIGDLAAGVGDLGKQVDHQDRNSSCAQDTSHD